MRWVSEEASTYGGMKAVQSSKLLGDILGKSLFQTFAVNQSIDHSIAVVALALHPLLLIIATATSRASIVLRGVATTATVTLQ